MKVRFPVSLKIILPFLIIAVLFAFILVEQGENTSVTIRWIAIAGIAVSSGFAFLQLQWFHSPVRRLLSLIGNLTKGRFPTFPVKAAKDELGDVQRGLQEHVEHIQTLTEMAGKMASGDFSGDIGSRGTDDEISRTMLQLRESLQLSVRESEMRQREDEHRTWTAQGMAKFSSLFRESEDDLDSLSAELIKELVAYTDGDVGALFIAREAEDGKMLLELKGSYAFDRQKYGHASFEFGEGLVGRAALERDIIYLTDLPPETIKIRSGLGEDRPSSLLLVPLVMDNSVLGVIELASLGHFPAYQIEFIRQLGEALATTLAKVMASLQSRDQVRAYREYSKREEELIREIERLKKS